MVSFAQMEARMSYINALGRELALSSASNSWPADTAGESIRYGSTSHDIFHLSGKIRALGGKGDDTYVLWDSSPSVVEAASEGVDTLDARFWGAAVLPDNVENLFLNSPGSTKGTGNKLDNIIVAGKVGATLNGLSGNDVLVGGEGADLFVVASGNGSDAIFGFDSGQDVIQLTGYGIVSFEQLKSMAAQVGSDVRFTFSNGESLVVRDVALSDLKAYDFGLPMTWPKPEAGDQFMAGAAKCYTIDGWYVLNNVWNAADLVEGKDFNIASSYDPTDLTSGVTFDWAFPVVTEVYQTIRAYPALIFGPSPYGGGHKVTDVGGVFPVKVSELSTFTADYDISYEGNVGGFNVAFDIWLTSEPNGDSSKITNELMIWVHKGGLTPFGDAVARYTDGDIQGQIYTTRNGASNYTALVLDQDMSTGEINIASVLTTLQKLGIVSANEYVAAVEFGAEVASGTGRLTINDLDLDVKTRPILIDRSGDDSIVYDALESAIDGGAGRDVLILKVGAIVDLSSGSSQVAGRTLVTGFEDVDASGSLQSVTLTASQFGSKLTGGSAADILTGGAGADIILGGGGADRIDGGAGRDQLRGEAGDDRIVYDANDYSIDGGAGRDTLVLTGAATVDLNAFSTSQVSAGSAYVSGFEDADASASTASVTLTASQFGSKLTGGSAADVLTGGAGADIILGGGGADRIDGGAGRDQLRGEAGDDRIVYDANDYSIDGGAGRDTLVLTGAATVDLNAFSTSQVSAGSAYVSGFEDADASASTASVTLTASQFGSKLTGGSAADVLTGGVGRDTFVFAAALGPTNVDVIRGFDPVGDTISLASSVFAGLNAGTLTVGAFHVGAAAADADDRIIYDRATGSLFFDQDGSGSQFAAVKFATLGTNLALSHHDFVIF